MFALKLVLATVFVVTSARHLPWDAQRYDQGYLLGIDEEGHPVFDQGYLLPEPEESYDPGNLARTRRESSSVTLNSDGQVPIASDIARGTVEFTNNMDITAKGQGKRFKREEVKGLQLENKALSLKMMEQNVPGLENSWTGAGKLNVLHNDNHNVDVRGSFTRHMPENPNVPNFNTFGGGVDYMFKDKVGASLDMASTPFQNRMDYSAMGNLNLYKNPTTSFDFTGGVRRMDTPQFSTGWKPNFGLIFSKSF